MEKAALDAAGVQVYRQENAWADTVLLTDEELGWINNSWRSVLDRHHKLPNGEYEPTLLFLDNLTSQVSDVFRSAMAAVSCLPCRPPARSALPRLR